MARNKFAFLAAGIVLAMVFTLSCSGDGGEEGGKIEGGRIDPSEYLSADRQVYILESAIKKFNGNGTVYFNDSEIEIGKIESGKLKLTLPNIKSEYPELLKKWDFCIIINEAEAGEQEKSCADPGYSISPANLTYYYLREIRVDAHGKNCRMSLHTVKSGKWSEWSRSEWWEWTWSEETSSPDIFYFSAPGNTTGTLITTKYDEVGIYNVNLSISEGWNFVYYVHVPDNYGDGYH